MPTLPLYQFNPIADAWHHVTAPGGYEWWYFDAEDRANDRQIVAIFLEGFVFHPGYLRKHFAYLRRPARRRPALPSEFPCAYFVLYEGGKIRAQFMTQYAPEQFVAARETTAVRIGPNTLSHGLDGLSLQLAGTPWVLTARGPQLLSDQTLAADLSFTPAHLHPPMERIFLSREMTGAEHHWVIANPICSVSGEINLNGEKIVFNGRGYHDHNYGTGPLGPGLKRWIWGRLLCEESVFTFHYAIPRDPSLPAEIHLVEANVDGIRDTQVRCASAAWDRRTILNLAYPSSLAFDDVLQLTSPRVIDSSPFYLRLIYDAAGRGKKGIAFCEVAYPHRLRYPILGRMIEMSIEKR
jgi:carotenoid 1,2-hydratase